MAEGILFSVITRPGCTIDDLKLSFAYVLQPRLLVELVRVLEMAGCLSVRKSASEPFRKKSPFDSGSCEADVFYVIPTKDAVERFSRIFATVPLPIILTSRAEFV
ncbi:unnamed protein product [Gongylonema pulchrum]|nr:unnamed protein product [Gongylonema pulchrum]